MAYVTGYDEDAKTVIWTEVNTTATEIDEKVEEYKKRGYKNSTCWAVEPSYKNQYFSCIYHGSETIKEEGSQ